MALLWGIIKKTGRSLHPDLEDVWNWPNTISYLIALRTKYDSFLELSEVPPEEHWDYPYLINRWIERLYPNSKNKSSAEVDISEIES